MSPSPHSLSSLRASRLLLVAWVLGLASLAFAASAWATEVDRPLSATERKLIYGALQAGPQPPEAPLSALPDATLGAMIVQQGRVETGQRLQPAQADRLWGLQPARRDIAEEFEEARRTGALQVWLQTLAPADPGYRQLLAAHRVYQTLVDSGGWQPLASGPVLRPGDRSPAAEALRQRLIAEGYALPSSGEGLDPPLVAALQRFQETHGLEADGVLGAQTRASLNVSAETRLAQIEANLERMRWTPQRLPATRLEVDVATAQATLFEDEAPVLSMRTIVGDLRHKTPIFGSELTAVVVNPPWNVPSSIARAEILPRAARDGGYLARNGFRFVDGRLQQRPGAGNALGRLKFDLQSPYGVYLHDTPGKGAFARPVRTLSHGCMRLEKPRDLAVWLLAGQGWTPARLDAAIAEGGTHHIALNTRLPLFVVYRTAFVEAGRLNLRPDPYGWDAALIAALAGRRTATTLAATDCADYDPA